MTELTNQSIDLEEAAEFLGFKSTERLRQKAKRGHIPGAFKLGKEWRFYTPRLVQYVENVYTTYTEVSTGAKTWHSVKRKAVHTTTQDSAFTESEFKNLRLQLSNLKPKNMKKNAERKSGIK